MCYVLSRGFECSEGWRVLFIYVLEDNATTKKTKPIFAKTKAINTISVMVVREVTVMWRLMAFIAIPGGEPETGGS